MGISTYWGIVSNSAPASAATCFALRQGGDAFGEVAHGLGSFGW